MAILLACGGNSGSGKSSSISTLDPKSTFIISVASKPLPFRGFRKNYTNFIADKEHGNLLNSSNPKDMAKVLAYIDKKRPDIKTVVLDD